MKEYNVIGLMSGTSLDGLDIAFCHFENSENNWSFEIKNAITFEYPLEILEKFKNLHSLSGLELAFFNNEIGTFFGLKTKEFISTYSLQPDFVSSHGHTVFHQPSKGLTLQIGNGAIISSITNLPVVCDFRTSDVANGGQGAPLVPIGDQLLFGNHEYCLNLGGISNISFQKNDKRIAFDISACNIWLNYLASQKGKKYDKNGEMAAKGIVNQHLLVELNNFSYFSDSFPKSLGIEWIVKNQLPLFEFSTISVEDKLATCVEHIAFQIGIALKNESQKGSLLITGGGTFNSFLVERIKFHVSELVSVEIPDKITINYKEALIFAFLGVLRMENEVNCLKSVTGASKDVIGGAVYI